jgi:hypothetical protein
MSGGSHAAPRRIGLPALTASVFFIVLHLAVAGCRSAPPRDIALVARGMTFALADGPDKANPVIPLRSGERVRLVLRNESPGMIHDLAIPAWDVAIASLRTGEQGDVTFSVPSTPGRVEYRCRPHAELMKGVFDVAP